MTNKQTISYLISKLSGKVTLASQYMNYNILLSVYNSCFLYISNRQPMLVHHVKCIVPHLSESAEMPEVRA